jgi:Ca-activated chloride channel family protein
MSFGWPIALAGLVLLPLLVVLYLWSERRRERSQAAFGNPGLLPNVIDRTPGKLRYLPVAILLVGLAAMIVGVARPHATVSVPREEATVILAMDVSRSMKAKDVQPTRLDAARAAAEGFLAQVPEKFRVGVVSFATRAAVGVAPTHDRALVEAALDSLAPGEGTAIGDAVALSLEVGEPEQLEEGAGGENEDEDESKDESAVTPRAIVLISDGAQDGGSIHPARAAEQARERGVPVHTVLVGTANGVVEETLTGGFRRIIRVPPSPETLQMLAEATGGQFFTAPDDERLREVYEELGTRLGEREESREITDVFAGAASVLLLLGGALSAFLFRRAP